MELPPMHARFTHTPMNFKNKEIRLLTVEPSSEPSSPIQITMEHFDFGSHIDGLARCKEEVARLETEGEVSVEQREAVYEEFGQETLDFIALSYTWGPESPVQDILVTSPDCRGWLSVRQNLYEFLTIRRDCDSAWFWIDQICINQGTTDEKAHQVNQMAEVYSAAAVEVWLGSEFEGSDELMDLIVRESIPSTQDPRPKLSVSKREMRTFIPPLRRFVRLPYWSRLWVIQEIVLGKVVDIRIGSKTISWDAFFLGWLRLREAWSSLSITKTDEDLGHYGSSVGARMWEINARRGQVDQHWYSVGGLVWGTECSDLRDRVFGAMGMVQPLFRMFPDYSMQPQDILLMLLTQQVEVTYAGLDYMDNLEDPDDPDSLHKRNFKEYVARIRRQTCVLTAEAWLPQLDDDKSRINPRSIRHHLLKILPLDPPQFGCRIGRTWQFKCYLWYKIPNRRSMRWRLSHIPNRFKHKAIYPNIANGIFFTDSDSI